MLKYTVVALHEMLKAFPDDEEKVSNVLNAFECANNKDVETFLKNKAVLFDKQGFSKTHLIYTSYKNEMVLLGYYALAHKSFVIKSSSKVSSSLKKRIAKFGQYDKDLKQYVVSAPLIGQLGKNDRYKDLISGDVLLYCACKTVKSVQALVGGKFVYLECEDKPRLVDFYKSNGFVEFGMRELEADERDDLTQTYLVQLLKYLK
jgi:hypothetical protein